jgi:hypothetical protein
VVLGSPSPSASVLAVPTLGSMKKLLILVVLAALAVVAVKKVQSV